MDSSQPTRLVLMDLWAIRVNYPWLIVWMYKTRRVDETSRVNNDWTRRDGVESSPVMAHDPSHGGRGHCRAMTQPALTYWVYGREVQEGCTRGGYTPGTDTSDYRPRLVGTVLGPRLGLGSASASTQS